MIIRMFNTISIILLWIAVFTVPIKSVLIDFMSSEDLKRYFDVSSIDKVPEYEIVSPYIEDENGRKRRDIETEDEMKEIKLKAFGDNFHMRLKENRYLLADGLEIEQLHANGTIDKIPLGRKRCFYIGQLVSHNISRVAVSTCKGMMGIIAMEKENLFIRPLRDDHAAEYRRRRRDVDNPHIIYKRSIDDEGKPKYERGANATHFCALDPDYYENATYFHDVVKLSKHKEAYLKKNKSVHTIKKRAVGCSVKFIEIRLLIDRDMLSYHGQDAIDYTITLMNTVAARFAETSLGALVHLHIAKLETIMTDSYTDQNGNNLQISAVGQTTLESLAAFQRNSYVYDDNDPNHWDVAVMVTRKNLRYGSSTALQGIAFEDGTCDVTYGAGLAQDSGLAAGQIIAHELGHTLGLDHDGSGPNANCPDNVNVMSSARPYGAGAYKWSTCSRQQFDQYLSDPGRSSCLNDVPVRVSIHPVNSGALPGYQVITADEQCRLLDSEYTGMCNSNSNQVETICERLLCTRRDNRCFYQVPAAEGTACGQGKWCISGACVSSAGQFPSAVNGGWSSWASYSQCSRTCGGGVRTRERCCDNPKPENGGTPCSGVSSEIELCNTEACTTSQPEFAHQQCEATANDPWQGGYYTWEAYFQDQTEKELCEFKCLNNINWVVPRGAFFQDGTRCSVDFRNELLKCVQGNCVEFGCDNKIDSGQRFDNCRVCGGTGSSCSPVTGLYNDGTPYQLTSFLDIPAGSTSVEISNTTPLTSFMALKTTSGQYLFGNGPQPVSGEYYTNGIFVKYFYKLGSEDIVIDGPTPVAFTAEVYRVQRSQRPTISYTYYTSNGVAPQPQPTQAPSPTYYWQTREGPCSVSCGSGTKQVSAQCFSSSTGTVVTNTFCNPATRPATTQQLCSLPVCPTPAGPSNYWMVSFGTCDVTCGYGMKSRSAICYSPSQGRTVADSECDPNTKPDTSPQQCFEQVCNYWIESEGPCSATCGLGTSVKSWRCFSPSSSEIVADNMCDASSRPANTQQSCFVTECNAIWVTYPFGDCDATCGTAYQSRAVICAIPSGQSQTRVQDSECAGQTKPETTILCNRDLPSCGVWHVGQWSQCSVTCGNGFRFRTVVCRPEGYEAYPNPPALSDSECRESKPSTQQSCDSGVICTTTDYYWAQGDLSTCSVTCGTGIQTWEIICVASSGQTMSTVADSFCQGLPQPPTQDYCVEPACPGVWQTLSYGQCSVTCGLGTQSRQVLCRPEGYESLASPPILPESQCTLDTKPESQRSCFGTLMAFCSMTTPESGLEYLWLPFNWDPCTATCGYATRTRRVWCVQNRYNNYVLVDDDSVCNGLLKPSTTEVCTGLPDCDGGQQPPTNNPDQGSPCAGLYTRSFNNLDHITQSNNGRYCNETIVAPVGQKIQLTFHRCNIQCDEGDEGAIRDGHRYFKLCCKDDTFQWTSISNVVQLEQKTTTNGHGYEISAQFVSNTGTDANNCDKLLTSATGSISSPSFPSTYSSDQTCVSTIVAPPGRKVLLDFQTFDLLVDAPWAPDHCFFPSDDNLEVYDLDTNTGTRYCGKYNDISQLRTTPLNNRVMLKFQSNTDRRGSNGFSLNYRVIDD
ncbi:A disintegrin and metalloproteinase with thrombospondin motifs 6-like [Amphiura filiformis]|uniref:A disintegrin and metalloproteinase with thrombospondin motifs 6-like n=1 Tax=Amphiura filiformis TaxID=82378 RepID=UPI003B223E66